MTILALDTSVSSAIQSGALFPHASSQPKLQLNDDCRPFPTRINLRKRSSGSNFRRANLTTVNSAFMSGLFTDVAQATTVTCLEDPQPTKKSRISISKSLARCERSFKEFATIQDEPDEKTNLIASIPDSPVKANTSFFLDRQDSLIYQLDCVSSCSAADISSGNKRTKLAFPHLPPAVSNSCCNKNLTRVVSDLQSSVAENTQQSESYGWFVEMEDEQTLNSSERVVDPYAADTSGTSSLAFQAPTAPKAGNYDAEVEWAKAADTVDDVLGDFF